MMNTDNKELKETIKKLDSNISSIIERLEDIAQEELNEADEEDIFFFIDELENLRGVINEDNWIWKESDWYYFTMLSHYYSGRGWKKIEAYSAMQDEKG